MDRIFKFILIFITSSVFSQQLHTAISNGNVDLVQTLINEGESINAKDAMGFTPLMLAAINQELEIVKVLVENNANINISFSDKFGATAFFYAYWGHNKNLISYFENIGANKLAENINGRMNGISGKSRAVLPFISRRNNFDLVNLMISQGADINIRDEMGNNCLFYAVKNQHVEMVRLLVDNGAFKKLSNVNQEEMIDLAQKQSSNEIINILFSMKNELELIQSKSDFLSGASLINAAYNGDELKVELILVSGGDVDSIDQMGFTALMYAISRNHYNVVEILLAHGANLFQTNCRGETALQIAFKVQNSALGKLLISNGANIDDLVNVQEIPELLVAVWLNDLSYVKTLLDKGHNPLFEKYPYDSAYIFAKEKKLLKIMEYFDLYLNISTDAKLQ